MLLSLDFIIKIKQKNLPGLQFIISDRMSLYSHAPKFEWPDITFKSNACPHFTCMCVCAL